MLVNKDKDLERIHDLIFGINNCAEELHSWSNFMLKIKNEYKDGKWDLLEYRKHLEATNSTLDYYSRRLLQLSHNIERIKDKL